MRELVCREGGRGRPAHPRAPGQCLHTLNAVGLLPVSGCGDARVAPPCPTSHHFVCVCGEIYLTLPTCPAPLGLATALARRRLCTVATRRTSINNAPASGEHLIKISQRSCHWLTGTDCPLGHHPRRRDAILGAAADGAAGTDSVVAGRGVGRRRMARRGRSKTPNTSEPEPSIAQKNKDVYNAASAPTREPTREPGSGACCDEARYRQGRAIHDSRGEPTPQTGDRSRAESTC